MSPGNLIQEFVTRASALTILLLLSPVLVVLCLVVGYSLGSPIMFSQERAGYLGRPFRLYKFRSMLNVLDQRGQPLPDEDRLTAVGRFLRKSSLDELPGLWNVVRGDMNFVGPRPLLMRYLPLYTKEQNRRHDVKPGITGWTQVNGRNSLSWDEKFELDVWYVANRSLLLDFKILLRTVLVVASGGDINSAGHATMPPFEGGDSSKNDSASCPFWAFPITSRRMDGLKFATFF